MTWTPYLVSLRILSPIYTGWRKTGNLQQTRPYVTGRNIWGALTNRLVRDHGGTNYQEIGEKVDDELRFTYFYPTTPPDNTTTPDKVRIWPWNNSDKFSWLYLRSYASTALSYKTAEGGMLHETEYISPRTRDGCDVYLIGYIIEKEGCELNWKEALKRIQIGGERGYGWGRIKLNDEPKKADTCFDYAFDGAGDSPQITIPKDKPILAHALAEGLDCKGTVEPLVGRETAGSKGFGDVVSRAEVCWVPGSIVKDEGVFEILKKRIWRRKKERK